MKRALDILAGLYAILCRAYPPAYRRDFSAEQAGVFERAAADAAACGKLALLRFAWREFTHLFAAICRARWSAPRRLPMVKSWWFSPQAPLPWRQALAGSLLLFLLGPVNTWLAYPYPYPDWRQSSLFQSVMTAVILLPTLVAIAIGFWRGFPRWTLPYLVFGTVLVGGLAYSWLVQWLLDRGFAQGMLSQLGLLVLFVSLALFSLVVIARTPPFASLSRRLKADWTLLSPGILVFGQIMFAMIDHDVEPLLTAFNMLPGILLWLAALFALRSRTPGARLQWLYSGLALATAVRTAGALYFLPGGIFTAILLALPAAFTWLIPGDGSSSQPVETQLS